MTDLQLNSDLLCVQTLFYQNQHKRFVLFCFLTLSYRSSSVRSDLKSSCASMNLGGP